MKNIIIITVLGWTFLHASSLLKEGEYSWFNGGSSAYLKISKKKNNIYSFSGDALYGIGRKYGPNMGEIVFEEVVKNGKLVYKYNEQDKDSDYVFFLEMRKDGSFDVSEKGFPPFGMNVSMSGHFTSENKPSFSCAKVSTFIEHAICDNGSIARLDRNMARSYEELRRALLRKSFTEKQNVSDVFDATLKKEQRMWMKSRDKCEHNKTYVLCLKKSYKTHIKKLDSAFSKVWDYSK